LKKNLPTVFFKGIEVGLKFFYYLHIGDAGGAL